MTRDMKRHILELFRLLDWLLKLPMENEAEFRQQLDNYEKTKVMPYVTSIERLAKEEGREEGRQMVRENLFDVLSERFHSVPEFVRERLNATRDDTLLRQFFQHAIKCQTLDEFETALRQQQ
jgi:hypothetical protein